MMDRSNSLSNIKTIVRQRNIAVLVGGLLLVGNVLLSIGIISVNREIVMVPGIEQEYRISGSKVSGSYLEEAASMHLTHMLDLTPENVMSKKDYMLRHTSAEGIKEINNYFINAQQQHKQYGFSTIFAAKNLEINPNKMEVVAKGILTSRYGKQGYNDLEVEFRLIYEMKGGRLKLKSFKRIDREAEKLELEEHLREEKEEESASN